MNKEMRLASIHHLNDLTSKMFDALTTHGSVMTHSSKLCILRSAKGITRLALQEAQWLDRAAVGMADVNTKQTELLTHTLNRQLELISDMTDLALKLKEFVGSLEEAVETSQEVSDLAQA